MSGCRLTLIKIVQVSFKNVVIYSFQCIVRWKWRHKEGRRQSSLFSSFFGPGYWWHVSVQLRPELSKRNPATRVDCTMLKYHPHCFKESVNTWLVTKHRCPTLITNALKTSRCTFQHCLTFHHEHVHFKKSLLVNPNRAELKVNKIVELTLKITLKNRARGNRKTLKRPELVSKVNFRNLKLKSHEEYLICRTTIV